MTNAFNRSVLARAITPLVLFGMVVAFCSTGYAQSEVEAESVAKETPSDSAPVTPEPAEATPVETTPVETTPVETTPMPAPVETTPKPAPVPVQTTTAPAPVQETYVPPPTPRPKKGLLIAGLATLGGGWLFSSLVGLQMMSGESTPEGTTCTNCDTVGPRLLIPLIGPFLAAADADGSDGRAVSYTMGVVQVTGLVLTIAGGIVYSKSKNPMIASKSLHIDNTSNFRFHTAKLTSGILAFSWR